MERSDSGAFARRRREREERELSSTAETRETPAAQETEQLSGEQPSTPADPVPAPLPTPAPAPLPVRAAVPDPTPVRVAATSATTVRRPRDEAVTEPRVTTERARDVASRIIKVVATVAGCCLITAALLIAVKANPNNSLVVLVRHLAQFVDLGFFSLSNPIKQFTGPHGPALTALLNYGIGAVVWFMVGGLVATVVKGKGGSR